MKPRIFIGSSSEGLGIAKEVKKLLGKSFDCIIWNDGKVFGLNVSYLDSLLKAGSMFDFGILVATKDDKNKSRGKKYDSPRDNVVFEFGLFMGRLGKFRTLILLEDGAKLPSDMSGIHISKYTGGKKTTALASLKKEIGIIRTHINQQSQLLELGLLPSTGTAIGCYTNFVSRACNYLRGLPDQKMVINGKTYTSSEVQVIVPKKLEHHMQGRANDYYKKKGLISYTFEIPGGRPLVAAVGADKKDKSKLLICDMPTTLSAVYDSIEMYLQKGHVGTSKEQELIEGRELNNFVAVLKAKVKEDSFSSGKVRFIEED